MSDSLTKPDLEFVRQLKAAGGENLKKCFQCATCSVVCKLSPDERPYPRKEMIWAQWGQREKLVTDPDVWLCHQCNDCSTYCPRGARPGDVLSAVRSYAIQHYATPSFMGKLVGDPGYVLLALAIPVIVLLGANYMAHGGLMFAPAHGEIHFSEFLPHATVNVLFSILFTLALIGGGVGLLRFWKDMKKHRPGAPKVGLIKAMVDTFVELALHGKFRTCGTAKPRTWAHLLIFYGFAGLFVVTGIVVIMLILAPDSYPINTLTHPLKIAGNLTGISLVVGCTWAIYNRLSDPDAAGSSTYYDWFFLVVLLMVGITGFGAQFARFREMTTLAYPVYFVHMVFIFALLIYLASPP
ncbi:MAG: quinone-interacting membrane-bound oxidoreductase complex subunit QmoC [Deltaproteobacteria bacterium]|nr:quinone-interacting membrane-bound oxidoreductase complex subunit QmoC [Deltaproteobacteria bacterium]